MVATMHVSQKMNAIVHWSERGKSARWAVRFGSRRVSTTTFVDCRVCRLRLVSGQHFSQVSVRTVPGFILRLTHRGSRSAKSVVVRAFSVKRRSTVVARALASVFLLFTRAGRGSVAGEGSLASVGPQKGRAVLRAGFPYSRVERLFTRAVEVAASCVKDDRCTAWRFNERRW
jgi:hypothetical protein